MKKSHEPMFYGALSTQEKQSVLLCVLLMNEMFLGNKSAEYHLNIASQIALSALVKKNATDPDRILADLDAITVQNYSSYCAFARES